MEGESWLDNTGEGAERRAGAWEQGARFVLLHPEDIDPAALMLIPEALSRKHQLVAYHRSEQGVEVALLDIKDLDALDSLRDRMHILPRLTDRASMTRALIVYQKHLKDLYGQKIRDDVNASRALNSLLAHALSQSASDAHLEPSSSDWLVRYRIGGMMHDAMRLASARGMVRELKSRANLSPTLNAPQEGRFAGDVGGVHLSVRVSTMPTASGERVALRFVPQQAQGFSLESLGFHGESLELLHRALQKKTGLILVAGPEGSGKTTTLYTLLDQVASPKHSIVTLEDYIEYRLPFASQTQVQKELGLDAAVALRALIKQDPDIVMVSNIRSHEVARIAEGAAKRLLVLVGAKDESMLKANVVVRQRLVGMLCPACKIQYDLSREEFDALDSAATFARVLSALRDENIVDKQQPWKDVIFYAAQGCEECEQGYVGLMGLQEVQSQEGDSLNVIEDGLFKAAQGLIDIRELIALAGEGVQQ